MRIMQTLTLTDTVMLISQTRLCGELLPERRILANTYFSLTLCHLR